MKKGDQYAWEGTYKYFFEKKLGIPYEKAYIMWNKEIQSQPTPMKGILRLRQFINENERR